MRQILQAIDEKGYQQELPDIWLSNGNPWEIPRPDITFKIGFYGTVDNFKWSPGETVSPIRSRLLVVALLLSSELGMCVPLPACKAAVHTCCIVHKILPSSEATAVMERRIGGMPCRCSPTKGGVLG